MTRAGDTEFDARAEFAGLSSVNCDGGVKNHDLRIDGIEIVMITLP